MMGDHLRIPGRAVRIHEQDVNCAAAIHSGIVAPGSDRVYTGFSHGAAGIGYFLLHLGLAAEEEKYVTLAEEAAAFLKAHATPLVDGTAWTKLVPARKKEYPVQWCHGSPGIALFFDALHAALGKPEHARLRDECVRSNAARGRTASA